MSEIKQEYNGLPSALMDLICKGLFARIEVEEIENWDILSLYLARICNVIEENNHIIPKGDNPEKWVNAFIQADNDSVKLIWRTR